MTMRSSAFRTSSRSGGSARSQRSEAWALVSVAAMDLHRDLAGAQLGRDLLVEQSRDDQCHHFPLAPRERLIQAVELVHFRPTAARLPMPVDRSCDRIQ